MATISTSQTFDSAARTAGEVFTIQQGAVLTIDSDTRDGKNAAAARAGSVGGFTQSAATGGEVFLDGTKVWVINYDGRIGTPNVPALGTIIRGVTSGAVGELMNCSASISTIPTAAGAAMPATGILKLKSKTGDFIDNETLEISGSTDLCLANGVGYRGWIEVAMDDAAAFTIGRAQKGRALGDWFVSETLTNGSRGQQIQLPNYGGANFFLPAIEVETAAGSGVYEKWKSMLSVAASGWAMLAGGMARAEGTTNGLNKFVKCLGGGIIQFGELLTQAGTYTWAANAVVVTFTAHGRQVGQQIYLDFTSGGATADGLYTITAVAANTMTVTLSGSGTAGNVTVRYDMGAVPVTGCKVRVPNIFLKSAATGSRASDSVPNGTLATRPDFVMTNAGQFDFEKVTGHWQFNLGQAYSVRMKDVHTFDQITITECATALDVTDIAVGNYTMGDTPSLVLASNFAGGIVDYGDYGRCGVIASGDYGVSVANCNNISFTGNNFGNRTQRTNAAGFVFSASQCKGLILQDNNLIGSGAQFLSCVDTTINGTKYADNFTDVSLAITPPLGAIVLSGYCVNTIIDGFSYYLNLTNVHPDTAIIYLSAAQKVRVQNVATRVAPLTGGSVNQLLLFINDAGNSLDISVKRCYTSNLATRMFSSLNSTKNWLVENCAGDYADTDITPALNGIIMNFGCASWPASGASIYGTIFNHIFTSVTAGRLGLAFNEPTEEYAAYVTTNFTTSATGTSGFNSNGGLALINSGDYAIYEFPRAIKGIDNFQNSAPTITTATNITTEYQIDTGSGWSAWKTFNAANLFAEVVDEVAGFKFKIRVTANATNAANILTTLYALTSSNAAAQDVLYPLDTATITANGVIPDSRIRVTKTSDSSVLFNEAVPGSSIVLTTDYAGEVRVEVRKGGPTAPYKPWFTVVTVGTGVSVTALQESDE